MNKTLASATSAILAALFVLSASVPAKAAEQKSSSSINCIIKFQGQTIRSAPIYVQTSTTGYTTISVDGRLVRILRNGMTGVETLDARQASKVTVQTNGHFTSAFKIGCAFIG